MCTTEKYSMNSQCNTFTSPQGDRFRFLRFNYSQAYFNSQVLVTGLTQNFSSISAPHIGRFFLQMILDIFCIHVSLLSGNMVTTVEYSTRQANLEMAARPSLNRGTLRLPKDDDSRESRLGTHSSKIIAFTESNNRLHSVLADVFVRWLLVLGD